MILFWTAIFQNKLIKIQWLRRLQSKRQSRTFNLTSLNNSSTTWNRRLSCLNIALTMTKRHLSLSDWSRKKLDFLKFQKISCKKPCKHFCLALESRHCDCLTISGWNIRFSGCSRCSFKKLDPATLCPNTLKSFEPFWKTSATPKSWPNKMAR